MAHLFNCRFEETLKNIIECKENLMVPHSPHEARQRNQLLVECDELLKLARENGLIQ